MSTEAQGTKRMYTAEEVYAHCWNIFVLGYSGYINSDFGQYPEGEERKKVTKRFNKWFKEEVK